MSGTLDRIIYLDDSGESKSHITVFGWFEISPSNWNSTLDAWLEIRKLLNTKYGIKPSKELHTSDVVHGRGKISNKVPAHYLVDGKPHWKTLGQDVVLDCLKRLMSIDDLKIGAIYRNYEGKGERKSKEELYLEFVHQYTEDLATTNSLALFFVDGNGTDPLFRNAHRSLDLTDRRIIEDSIQLSSKHSQFIQIADLIAYCALAHVDRAPNNEFAWDWYKTYLSQRDPKREPIKL